MMPTTELLRLDLHGMVTPAFLVVFSVFLALLALPFGKDDSSFDGLRGGTIASARMEAFRVGFVLLFGHVV